jgi:eukaryotic-like serine/threonine-protein kinase
MKFTFAPESKPLDGYTIKRAIHRGGFGEVYYALSNAGKEVALKLLNNNLDVELRGVSQCMNLSHPNLVTIFDIRQDSDNDHWIVMEYVGGRGLYEVMNDHPNGMPLRDVMSWLTGISAGLSFLHDRGIVHRDLKPANVFADAGIVKIGDVGLSKYITESRRSAQTQSVGTVYYMAPEVSRGRYGREVDIYAVGIMLFEMLTGRVPFEGETTAEILMKHLTADPNLEALPEPLRKVLAEALEKDPEKRIHDVEDLERRFRNAVTEAGLSTDAKSPNLAAVHKPAAAAQAAAAKANAWQRAKRNRERSLAGINGRVQPFLKFWNERVPTPLKWIICGALFLMLLESGVMRPVAAGGVVGGMAYLLWRGYHRVFRRKDAVANGVPHETVVLKPSPVMDPKHVRPAVARPTQSAPQPLPRPAEVRIYTPATVRQIPRGQRMADITTSMSVALFAVALVTVAVHLATSLLPDTVDVVYFGTVTLLAAWALVVPAKLWEGRSGDAMIRRLVQGTMGLGVGAAAGFLQQFLLLDEAHMLHSGGLSGNQIVQLGQFTVRDAAGLPTMAGFMVFFGFLFLARRWWWQVDSFRKSRFRISSALVTLMLGAALTVIAQFPENLGATWALAISAVVQLSAGWTPQEERFLAPAPEGDRAPPVMAQVKHPVAVKKAAVEA